MTMKSQSVINGSYGKVYENGQWLMNVYGLEATGDVNYEEVARSGTRALGQKATTVSYTGSMQAHHVSNEFTNKIRQISDDSMGAHFTELIVSLEDPENPQMAREKIRLKGVQFTNIPIISFEHGSLVGQELQFVFEGFETIVI